ncbi:monocarboxylate uptake permease MctP [Alicyclobacillus acidiphilus]|uniref:monocarboxylate uptake permease MctP n=1 Tax=Alicyclobacillus acidiphilus TaxID=182455 RepID=UPI000836AF2E|nr:sodium:solute symporter [Alicyclobacillus acidiphilus]
MQWAALIVFIILFALVTVLGFVAARWRRGDLSQLEEWGLAGRRFGTIITWFLVGGDLYTAYTFIAVPALMYGAGAMGFYAVPYTIVVYPVFFIILPRLWSVAKKHGYVTAADFVEGRFDDKLLALAIAITGIVATMPYIALQLTGMQAVIAAMGIGGDWPLIVAFIILALYTYTSGLRAPAMIAVVKDLMIYITVIVAIIVIPIKLGGFSHIFHSAQTALATHTPPGAFITSPQTASVYGTLAFGSALALFLYPHAMTGVFSANSRKAVKRNMALLPAYSFALGIIALLGFMALAAGINTKSTSSAVPLLFIKEFPGWFAGFGFAAIAIGALVPAAIMSIAASNLFTRNIYKTFFYKNATSQHEAKVAKIVSLLVKLGALVFIIGFPQQYAISMQQVGGILVLQTLPALILGLYTRWFHRRALLIGWLAGIVYGIYMWSTTGFKSTTYVLNLFGHPIAAYAAIWALIVNVIVTVVLTLAFNAAKVYNGEDSTVAADYSASL